MSVFNRAGSISTAGLGVPGSRWSRTIDEMKAAKTRMRSAFGRGRISGVGRRLGRAHGFDRRFQRRRCAGAERRNAPGCSRPSPLAAGRAARRPPLSANAPNFRAPAPMRARSAARTASSCCSAQIRRRNAASSTAKSRVCRPISPTCRRAPAAAPAILSPATTPNAFTPSRQGPAMSSRLCSAA